MDSKKSKKTRSYGEAPKTSRNPVSSPSPTSGSRPQFKDRVKSAPPAAQSSRLQNARPQKTMTNLPSPEFEVPERSNIDQPSSIPTLQEPSSHQQVAPNFDQIEIKGELPTVTLAVIGAARAGKSTFVQCALDLKKSGVSPSSIKKVSLEGVVSVLRLLEIQLEDVGILENHNINWPSMVGNLETPRIHGALVLCDVMDRSSMADVVAVLNACSNIAIPTVLISSKCDNPRKAWQIDQRMIEGLCNTMDGVESFQTSANSPETHKRCVSVILRKIMSERAVAQRQILSEGIPKLLKVSTDLSVEHSQTLARSSRPRAVTSTQSSGNLTDLHTTSAKSKHGRAISEMSVSNQRDLNMGPSGSMPSSMSNLASCGEQSFSQSRLAASLATEVPIKPSPSGTRRSSDSSDDEVLSRSPSPGNTWAVKPLVSCVPTSLSSPGISTTISTSILETYDGHEEHSLDMNFLKAGDKNLKQTESTESGASFDELVDRLLSPSMSKSDSKFRAIFLCLYRKFAAPSDLMSAIIHRFEKLNSTQHPQILRNTSQLRYLSVLAQWISDYPGDFAHPLTRRSVTNFIAALAGTRIFAVASKEMNAHLDVVVDDDDTEWACSDTNRSRASTVGSFLSTPSVRTTTWTHNPDSPTEGNLSDSVVDEPMQRQSTHDSATTSIASSAYRSGSQSTGSFQTLLSSVESAQRQAQLLSPIPRNPLTKTQWHQFMETSDEDVARELTRIDWIMFSSIRPRDLIRHVSLPVDQKEKCKSLKNVNRMIDHFNHVAFWVANLILLRDKPKHRAKALERFMGVAWKLRYLNNYNSLSAVIAGINGTAVHRLAQTRELVTPQAQKQFMRLEILMGTQKSNFAYRLAWANTSSERIPFLPLHRRDLVFAEEGNRTYLSGDVERINWKKFDIMGEVIVGIQKSQGTPYPHISRNDEVQRLILDGIFTKDDDELYDRSLQIEGPRAGENTRKMFQWFQR